MIRNIELSKQFIEEIKRFETIYCLVSGGYHSTTSALLLKDDGFENVILLHNNSLLETDSSKKTMRKLIEITGYQYIETKPELNGETIKDVLKKSFAQVSQMKKDVKNGRYGHSNMYCCNVLKKKPAKDFYKRIDKENSVVISSICPFESARRAQWIWDLRKNNTYLRLHKKMGKVWHAYPLRDYYSEKAFLPYLQDKGFTNIQHSGCRICPILLIFNMYDNKRWYDTARMFRKMGFKDSQKFIIEYS